jgi:hypothetical protein
MILRPDDPSNPFQTAWALALARWTLERMISPQVNQRMAFLTCHDQPVVIFSQYLTHGNTIRVRVFYNVRKSLNPKVLSTVDSFSSALIGVKFASAIVDFTLTGRDHITIDYCRSTVKTRRELIELTTQMPSLREIDLALKTRIEPSFF